MEPASTSLPKDVSKLLLLVPAEDQGSCGKEEVEDVEVEKVLEGNDVEVESTRVDEDVCDAMAPSVSSSFNSPDVEKQDEVAAVQDGKYDEEPGGNVAPSRRSPRFGHTNA